MGSALQYLYAHTSVTVNLMTALRLIIAGPFLLSLDNLKSTSSDRSLSVAVKQYQPGQALAFPTPACLTGWLSLR